MLSIVCSFQWSIWSVLGICRWHCGVTSLNEGFADGIIYFQNNRNLTEKLPIVFKTQFLELDTIPLCFDFRFWATNDFLYIFRVFGGI